METSSKQQLLECAPRWRTRLAEKNPSILAYLNAIYPGVQLSLQIDSLLTGNSPYCAVCKSPVKSVGKLTCSTKCRSLMGQKSSNDRVRKQKETLLKKYGVDNVRKIPGVEDKRKQTLMENYGSMVSPLTRLRATERADEFNQKSKASLMQKYGVENSSQITGHREKCKATLIENYGVDHYTKSDEFLDMAEQRRFDRYLTFCPTSITLHNISSDLVEEKEQQVKEFISSLGISNIVENQRILDGAEIDIFLPDYTIGFDFNGLYCRNDLRISRNYHKQKTTIAADHGITLIHIFEDEWEHSPEIVKSRIANLLHKTSTKIYGRQCIVKPVSPAEEREFLTSNHIQGYTKSSVKLGLYYQDQLVSLMTFSKPNLAKGQKKEDGFWELLRFCNKINTNVVGGANKLFSHFISSVNPLKVLSFADSRWSTGHLYQVLGFDAVGNTGVNYWYINLKELKRIHRFGLRKTAEDDQSLTEYENRLKQGYLRIWDCGSTKWVWNKK